VIPILLSPARTLSPILQRWWKGEHDEQAPHSCVSIPISHKPKRIVFENAPDARQVTLEQLYSEQINAIHDRAVRLAYSESPSQTLSVDELVNEGFLRISQSDREAWNDLEHFLKYCTTVMRSILIDRHRETSAAIWARTSGSVILESLCREDPEWGDDVRAMQLALEVLARENPRMAKVVELRFFQGRDRQSVAEAVGLAPRTLDRQWKETCAWLREKVRPAAKT